MENEKVRVIEKHPRAIRWMHWINFPMLALMIWSGILIYWANPAYLNIPDLVSMLLHIPGRLAEGLGWHFFLMALFTLNGFIYVSYLALSGEWKALWPGKNSIRDAVHVALHDLHLRKNAPKTEGKFNAAQRISYCAVILMGLLSVLTGFAIYKPVQLGILTSLLGGYEAARLEHFILMMGFILFFLVHVSQVVKAGWNNFRAMMTGYEIEK